ncbi:putative UPF0481 protein At3g02645 [Macadamia integrifolia]|uniref:putative UPF0481 protein At3g02645 n=1 Tax=Macadamia integrifolia TaxID=60698 RepID=UPI001C4FA4D5|nr:putative UPF0481 protein At3g02645 [Macadamia integrifolia]
MANATASSSSNSTIQRGGCKDRQLNNDYDIRMWVGSIEEERRGVCSWQSGSTIFRVPNYLRKIKPEVYIPQSVSIGPLHYNEEHLQPMQVHKLRYLNRFLDRHKWKISLDDCVKAVSELEEKARKCYSETTGRGFEKDEFVKMMVIDSCFILELFEIIKNEENDLFLNPSWFHPVLFDLITLENQLPLFVLEHIYGLIYELQTPMNNFSQAIYDRLLRWFDLHDASHEQLTSVSLPEGGVKHLLDLLRSVLVNSSRRIRKAAKKWLVHTNCASELERAGVKFQKLEPSSSPESSLFDINFDINKGVLTIPTITIFDETEHTLRNLIALEKGQVLDITTDYFTAYAAFMDGLIDTRSDVELLEKKGIIVNNIGNPEDVVTLFNNIVKHVTVQDPYFSGVIEDVIDYYNKPWNRRQASLMQNYFNTPWAFISFLAALFLLILTVGQTICSILQVVWTQPP